jgi:hypothetical protein
VRNNAATAGRREPQEVVDAIRAFWERELKDDPLAW